MGGVAGDSARAAVGRGVRGAAADLGGIGGIGGVRRIGGGVRRVAHRVAHFARVAPGVVDEYVAIRRCRGVESGGRLVTHRGAVHRSVGQIVEIRPLGLPEAADPDAEREERKPREREANPRAALQNVTRTPIARAPNHGIT